MTNINTTCCGKEMIKIKSGTPNKDIIIFVCGECGNITQISTNEVLDDEELWDICQTFKEELGATKIYAELKKEMEK